MKSRTINTKISSSKQNYKNIKIQWRGRISKLIFWFQRWKKRKGGTIILYSRLKNWNILRISPPQLVCLIRENNFMGWGIHREIIENLTILRLFLCRKTIGLNHFSSLGLKNIFSLSILSISWKMVQRRKFVPSKLDTITKTSRKGAWNSVNFNISKTSNYTVEKQYNFWEFKHQGIAYFKSAIKKTG